PGTQERTSTPTLAPGRHAPLVLQARVTGGGRDLAARPPPTFSIPGLARQAEVLGGSQDLPLSVLDLPDEHGRRPGELAVRRERVGLRQSLEVVQPLDVVGDGLPGGV